MGGEQKKADVPLDENCRLCSSKLMMRFGRFGEFTSCSSYPACKYIKQKTIGVKCPNCTDGEVVERRSKRQDVLRLQQVSGVRFRRVGQADLGEVPELQGMQVQAGVGASGGCGSSGGGSGTGINWPSRAR